MNTQQNISRTPGINPIQASELCHKQARAIAHRTRGSQRGPITRLMSPLDWGQLLKPFVLLDFFSFQPSAMPLGIGMHPHSGIASVTIMTSGSILYEDTTGKGGMLPAGGMGWMNAGNGIWHSGIPLSEEVVRGVQLWIALPAFQENVLAESRYVTSSQIPQEGPVRVLLGRYGSVQGPIPASSDMTYLAVTLKDGERLCYTPPLGHTVAWLAVSEGQLRVNGTVTAGELAVFEESNQAINIVAQGESSFVLGSAVKHPHQLVVGDYSVHTNQEALAQGEAEIQRIGAGLWPDK